MPLAVMEGNTPGNFWKDCPTVMVWKSKLMASGILVHGPRVSKKELELWTLEMGLVIWVLSEMDSHMKESIIGVTVA